MVGQRRLPTGAQDTILPHKAFHLMAGSCDSDSGGAAGIRSGRKRLGGGEPVGDVGSLVLGTGGWGAPRECGSQECKAGDVASLGCVVSAAKKGSDDEGDAWG